MPAPVEVSEQGGFMTAKVITEEGQSQVILLLPWPQPRPALLDT